MNPPATQRQSPLRFLASEIERAIEKHASREMLVLFRSYIPGTWSLFRTQRLKAVSFLQIKMPQKLQDETKPRKVKWTKAYRALHGKEATRDSAFEFERQRNRPRRYDRKVAQNTILAMRRVEDIKSRRAQRFHEMRMGGKEDKSRGGDKRELEQQIHLVGRPSLFLQATPLSVQEIIFSQCQFQRIVTTRSSIE